MNVNFGLFPPLTHAVKGEAGRRLRGPEKALAKKRALTTRALIDLERWLAGGHHAAAALASEASGQRGQLLKCARRTLALSGARRRAAAE